MKKKGFTLVELMVAISVLMTILGSISLIITSHSDTYRMGKRNEMTGGSFQTFYAYMIRDITPDREEFEENYVEIRKSGDPLRVIEVRRSWMTGTWREIVKYIYEDGMITRGEYYLEDREEEDNQTPILKAGRNFHLTGMGLRVAVNDITDRDRIITPNLFVDMDEEELQKGVRLGNDEGDTADRHIYYIEPQMILDEGNENLTIARGYGLRFAPRLVRQEEEDGMSHDDLIWCNNGIISRGGNNYTFNDHNMGSDDAIWIRVRLRPVDEQETPPINRVVINNSAYPLDHISTDLQKVETFSGRVSIPRYGQVKIEVWTNTGNVGDLEMNYYLYREEYVEEE